LMMVSYVLRAYTWDLGLIMFIAYGEASQPSRRTASAAQPTDSEARQGVVCQCGEPAGERTVAKDGPNKGRKFFTCGKDRTCNFFEWFDGPSKPSEGAGGFSGPIPVPRSTIPAKRKSAEYVVRAHLLSIQTNF
jgi:hypothetical protein